MSFPFEPRDEHPRKPWSESRRRVSVILWSGFVGAVFLMPVLLWADHHGLHGMGELTFAFMLAWVGACIPAWKAQLLCGRPPVDGEPPSRESKQQTS